MRSKISLFNKAVYLDDLRRSWPLWGSALLMMLLAGPVRLLLLNNNPYYYYDMRLPKGYFVTTTLYQSLGTGIVFGMLFGCAAAMLLLGSLYQSRSAIGTHALPVTRPQLFGSHYLAGLTMCVAPLLLAGLLTVPVQSFLQLSDFRPLLSLMAAVAGSFVWNFSFACFCGMFTGQLLGLPAFFFILSFLSWALNHVWQTLCTHLLYGYTWQEWMTELAHFLSPVSKMLDYSLFYDTENATVTVTGLKWLAVYAVAGLVLSVLTLWLYRRRQLEWAGETVTLPAVRALFRVGVGVCGAFTGGAVLSSVMNVEGSGLMSFLCMLPGAVIGFFGAQMLLRKSLRVFTGRLLAQFAVMLAASGAVIAILSTGGLGYETRVPDPQQIVSAKVSAGTLYGTVVSNNNGIRISDPQQLQILTQLHADYIQAYNGLDQQRYSEWVDLTNNEEAQWGVDFTSNQLGIEYTLANGRTVSRSYQLYVTAEALDRSDSPESRLETLLNDNYDYMEALNERRSMLGGSMYPVDGYATPYYRDFPAGELVTLNLLRNLMQDLQATPQHRVGLLDVYAPEGAVWTIDLHPQRGQSDLSDFDTDADWFSFTVRVDPAQLPGTAQMIEQLRTDEENYGIAEDDIAENGVPVDGPAAQEARAAAEKAASDTAQAN